MRVLNRDQIVDTSEDIRIVRKRRRLSFLRIGIPILGVALVIVAIFGIAAFSHYANRRDVLALSDNLLATLDAQIAQRVAAFVDPGERTLRIMRHIVANTPSDSRRDAAERFAVGALRELPQVASLYLGDENGNFLMMRRNDVDGFEIKQVVNDPGQRQVTLVERNAAFAETERHDDPTDTFDPRTRPWYQGALKGGDVFWTGIYVFFSDRKPGITVSTHVPNSTGGQQVLGLDITLAELSKFLGGLEIGKQGRAYIIDGAGHLVAAPDIEAIDAPVGTEPVPKRIDQLGDETLTAAFDRFRVEGQGRRTIGVGGRNFISSATPLREPGRDWWVLIVVPEDDFIGFVAGNNRVALAMSGIIVIAVIALAALLVRQGLRSDRSVRRIAERSRAMDEASAAYLAISERIADRDAASALTATERIGALTGASRISVWSLNRSAQLLRCVDSFDQERQGHAGGFELHRRELPQFFEALQGGADFTAADARADPRSAQFYNVIMRPFGSRALSVSPLQRAGRVVGAICVEDAGPIENSETLRTIGALLVPTFEISGPEIDEPTPTASAEPAAARDRAPADFVSSDIALSPAECAALTAVLHPEVAAMVLRISGSLALAKRMADGEVGLAQWIVEVVQDAAAEHGIAYVKLVGQQIIAATGFEPGDQNEMDRDPMTRIAALAIDVRDQFLHRPDSATLDAEFRIGLGFGPCFGCLVGHGQNHFNLWGEAIEMADLTARTAAPGAVQATEGAYDRLRKDFLFRPRGSFYRPGRGESRTFVLAGQL
jgi:class 3 adenylate cyclase